MNKKLLFITMLGLYIPLTTLTSEKQNHQTTQKYSLHDFNHEQDTEGILEIFNKERQWLNSSASPSSYRDDLLKCKKPSCNIKVLRENEELAGYVMYKKNWLKQGDITQLAVSDNVRNKGYGKLLVATAIEDLKAMDARSIDVACYQENTQALAFYKKMGFITTRDTCDLIFLRYNPTLTDPGISKSFITEMFRQPWDV